MSRRRREERVARRMREVTGRAVGRLAWFEWLLLGGAVVVALGGGALTAALLARPLGVPFRLLWAGASLLMFVVPGGLALRGRRREERTVGPPTDPLT